MILITVIWVQAHKECVDIGIEGFTPGPPITSHCEKCVRTFCRQCKSVETCNGRPNSRSDLPHALTAARLPHATLAQAACKTCATTATSTCARSANGIGATSAAMSAVVTRAKVQPILWPFANVLFLLLFVHYRFRTSRLVLRKLPPYPILHNLRRVLLHAMPPCFRLRDMPSAGVRRMCVRVRSLLLRHVLACVLGRTLKSTALKLEYSIQGKR